MQHTVEAISLALTFITLQLCGEAIYTWFSEAKKFFRGGREPWLWAGAGVFIHFTASFLDNTYWGIAWSLQYAENAAAESWFNYGAWVNIPFRQIGTAVAGFCYIKAARSFQSKHMDGVYKRMSIALVLGILYVIVIRPF